MISSHGRDGSGGKLDTEISKVVRWVNETLAQTVCRRDAHFEPRVMFTGAQRQNKLCLTEREGGNGGRE